MVGLDVPQAGSDLHAVTDAIGGHAIELDITAANAPERIGEELADVLCYSFALANALNLDLAGAVPQKMVRNAEKYPAEQFRGRYGEDDRRS